MDEDDTPTPAEICKVLGHNWMDRSGKVVCGRCGDRD